MLSYCRTVTVGLLTLILLSLSGCGFHLRGNVALAPPLQQLYLKTSDPYGELARNLQQYLTLIGVHLTSSPANATAVLTLLHESETQNLISIDITQLSRQYNLILTVSYEITTPTGRQVVPPQTVTESRTLPIQSNQILAGSNEETILYQQMRQAIVYDIVSQLSSHHVTSLVEQKQP